MNWYMCRGSADVGCNGGMDAASVVVLLPSVSSASDSTSLLLWTAAAGPLPAMNRVYAPASASSSSSAVSSLVSERADVSPYRANTDCTNSDS